jgi:uncharacterized integral membrane protein
MNVKLILSLILVGLAVIFIIQNVAVVEIQFLFWTMSMSRALFMFLLLAIGLIVGWVGRSFAMQRKNKGRIQLT